MGRWLTTLLAILTLAPVALWLGAVAATLYLGQVQGCTIHEGYANPCPFLGRDIADTAYALGMFAAWGPLFLMPVVAPAGLLWLVVGIIRTIRRRRA
ncbi:hypothetical protein [Chachezhania antarctica]|uniref:hypothetical protein n=1 Tax=Chachezhania antarctica TaxID=2340860 RepID=UPI001F091DA1|nr:hypothetical protein [Chachezhania antarctica]|tara:strand:- start:1081 stop:1371 length:291 start_codon:yes stop_codon:yes gene_type:complete